MTREIIALKAKITEGEETIRGGNKEIATLRKELKENKELNQELNKEIGNNKELNEAIIIENEALKVDRANKSITLERCTEAVRSVRKKMRIQEMEIKEIKGAGPQKAENSRQNHNLNKEEMRERQEKGKKIEELEDNKVKVGRNRKQKTSQ